MACKFLGKPCTKTILSAENDAKLYFKFYLEYLEMTGKEVYLTKYFAFLKSFSLKSNISSYLEFRKYFKSNISLEKFYENFQNRFHTVSNNHEFLNFLSYFNVEKGRTLEAFNLYSKYMQANSTSIVNIFKDE